MFNFTVNLLFICVRLKNYESVNNFVSIHSYRKSDHAVNQPVHQIILT